MNHDNVNFLGTLIDKAGKYGRNLPLASHFQGPYRWVIRHFKSPIDVQIGEVSVEFERTGVGVGIEKERDRLREVMMAVDEDETFYDIGANIGLYTCFVAQKVTSSNVCAFEPSPVAFRYLERNITRNEVDAQKENIALSDSDTNTNFAVDTADPLSRQSSIIADEENMDHERYSIERVNVRRGEDYLREHGLQNPDVIKIDAEGEEYNILQGFESILPDVRIIFCEIHPDSLAQHGINIRDIRELLEGNGFEVEYRECTSFLRAEHHK